MKYILVILLAFLSFLIASLFIWGLLLGIYLLVAGAGYGNSILGMVHLFLFFSVVPYYGGFSSAVVVNKFFKRIDLKKGMRFFFYFFICLMFLNGLFSLIMNPENDSILQNSFLVIKYIIQIILVHFGIRHGINSSITYSSYQNELIEES